MTSALNLEPNFRGVSSAKQLLLAGALLAGLALPDSTRGDPGVDGTWSLLPPPYPPGRTGSSLVHDSNRNEMLLFGGGTSGGDFQDTWVLSLGGTPTWSALTTSGTLPQSRSHHTATYDPVADRMYIHGGYSQLAGAALPALQNMSSLNRATGAWQTYIVGSGPGQRFAHASAYDPGRGEWLFFAGRSSFCMAHNDSWAMTLTNRSWSAIAPLAPLPSARDRVQPFHDSLRDRFLAIGGCRPYCQGVPTYCGNEVLALSRSGPPAWSVLATSGPEPLAEPLGVAYDSLRDRLLVISPGPGQTLEIRALYPATMTYMLLAPDGAAPSQTRAPDGMAYDPVGDRLIYFEVTTGMTYALTWSGVSGVESPGLTPPGPRLSAAAPNPFRVETTFRVNLPRADRIRLTIHDVMGRLVRDLAQLQLTAGAHRFRWDGRDDTGAPVPGGVYFGRLSTAVGTETTRIVRLTE